MKRKFVIPLILAILILGVTGCNDTSILSSMQTNTTYIEVKSLNNGDILNKSEEVTFSVVYPETTEQTDHTSLNIVLENLTTGDKKESSIDSPTLNQDIQLDLGDLETGEYLLTIQFLSNGEVKTESKTTFFYVTGNYRIEGIQSFPPIIFPNTQITLSADLDIPEGSNPFIRWSEDGKIIQKGYLNEGLNSIKLKAPGKPGVYSVKLELFPFGPITSNDFSFSSSITSNSEIYVSPQQPANSYYSVIFFTNPPFDYGTAPKEKSQTSASIQIIGNPQETKLEGTEGYNLKEGDGFQLNYSLLPFDSSGALQPFTLSMEILFDSVEKNASVLTLLDKEGDILFKIETNAKGLLEASFTNTKSKTVTVPSGIGETPVGEKVNLSFSFLPENGNIKTLWFLNGYQTAKGTYPDTAILSSTPDQLETIIGGNEGFSGSIFSIKVYYKDKNNNQSINPNILRDFLDKKYGDKLIFCDGFDGEKITDAEEGNGSDFSNAYIDPGYLILEKNGEYKTSYFEIPEGTTELTIAYPESESQKQETLGQITVTAGALENPDNSTVLFTISNGSVEIPQNIVEANELTEKDISQLVPFDHNLITFRLIKQLIGEVSTSSSPTYSLALQVGNAKPMVLLQDFRKDKKIQLQIQNNSKKQISIDYITVISTE